MGRSKAIIDLELIKKNGIWQARDNSWGDNQLEKRLEALND